MLPFLNQKITHSLHLSSLMLTCTGQYYIPIACEAQGLTGPTPDYAQG